MMFFDMMDYPLVYVFKMLLDATRLNSQFSLTKVIIYV
jgi:hypothetical protein